MSLCTEHLIRMTYDIFGRGHHRKIDSMLNGGEEERCTPRVIGDSECAVCPGDSHDGRDVLDLHGQGAG